MTHIVLNTMSYAGKTKEDLAKLGIHDLHHTPGKLITAKGHIDGYLSAYGIVYGKLKMTPEQAQKAMGFTPKKGAVGVLLSRRRYIDKNGKVKSGIFAISLMPRSIPQTKKFILTHHAFPFVGKFASKHLKDIIHPIWNPIVKYGTYKNLYDGVFCFSSINNKALRTSDSSAHPPLNLKKFIISDGPLPPPKKAPSNWFDLQNNQLHFLLPKTYNLQPFDVYQLGILILDIFTGDSFHIPPFNLTRLLFQNLQSMENPISLLWTPKNIGNYSYEKKPFCSTQRSGFFGYIYYKAPKKLPHINHMKIYRLKHLLFIHNYSPFFSDFQFPEPIYSPSLSFRIKIGKNRKLHSSLFHLVINIK